MPQNNYTLTIQGKDNLSPIIKNAQKALTDLGEKTTKLEDIQKGFDKIKNSSAPLSRKIGDIRKQMEALVVSGEKTTAQGEEMYKKLSEAAKEYDQMLKQIQADSKNMDIELPDLSFKKVGKDLAKHFGIDKTINGITSAITAMNPVITGVGVAVAGTMIAAGKAASEFEIHLDSLQALTGLTEKEMKSISDGAVEMSKGFKASAGEIVDAMKLIGSQAPELLKNSDALMEVTKAANVLSEAAEISVEDAAKAITGTMNQMGASASEATEIINTFAAASQQGSADVAYLNKAFEKSGTAASSAGMNYVQLASAIESIAPKFSSADVAGSQLASTLLKLSMSGNADFMPSVVGMSKALENLAKAEMDDSKMKELVGESNITMLKSLIQARDQFDSYCSSLKGTNTAFEQMAINNDNFAGAINRLKSAWDAFLITLGQSGLIQGIADNIMMVMDALMEVVNVISDVIKAFEEFGGESDYNINIAKIQLDLLIGVIKGVGEVLNIIIRIAAKVFNSIKDVAGKAADWIGEKWNNLKKTLGDNAFVRVIINAFNKVIEAAANMINAIKKYWNKLKEWLGLKTEANLDVKVSGTNLTPETVEGSSGILSKVPNKKEKNKKGKKKEEKIKTQLEIDRENLQKVEREVKQAFSDFNSGLIDKSKLVDTVKNANDYFANNGIKNKVGFQFSTEDGFEKAKQIALHELSDLQLNLPEIEIKPKLVGLDEFKAHLEVMAEETKREMDEITNTISSLGSVFGSLGSAIGGAGGEMAKFAGQAISSAGSIIETARKITFAKQGEAMATGAAEATKIGFPQNIPAILSIIATLVGVFSQIPKFESGGVVGGTSYHGDKLLARVNSGELILNKAQQSRLYKAMNSDDLAQRNVLKGDVNFTISGSALKGTLRNYDQKMSKIK